MKELFPVEEQKLITDGGSVLKGKKAIVRTDTKEVLGIVSDRYKLVRHKEVLGSVYQVLGDMGFEEKSRHLCKKGAVLFSKFYGNGEYKSEVKVGDIVRFGVEIFNSYNGSLPVGGILIAERLKCSNGMIVPETVSRFSVKHFGSLDLSEIRVKALEILGRSMLILDRWKDWNYKKIEVSEVREFFYKTFGNRYREKLFQGYLSNKEGDTVWDLYNFLTSWSTHDVRSRRGNEENKRLLQWSQETRFTNGLVDFMKRR